MRGDTTWVGDVDFGPPPDVPRMGDARRPGLPVFRSLRETASEVNDLRAQFEEAFSGARAPLRITGKGATKGAACSWPSAQS